MAAIRNISKTGGLLPAEVDFSQFGGWEGLDQLPAALVSTKAPFPGS